MAAKDKPQDEVEANSVDLLNQKYREEAEAAAKKAGDQPEPNPVDELNREYQDGEPTAAAQTEASDASLNPPDGAEKKKKSDAK